eukprot:CAMPEP_0172822394 /NCGR_PEP_ID=MMETSP1075-20121228/16646_1 /TAXON_ID=2916 /ORGANISM="Ceratium fusus, Strain PA161109" /LENGTH=63 /DNA_ID=CAMNT_0013663373 /DNA_START=8 /DNA_END=195 /DNA_ORIENTATION=+
MPTSGIISITGGEFYAVFPQTRIVQSKPRSWTPAGLTEQPEAAAAAMAAAAVASGPTTAVTFA